MPDGLNIEINDKSANISGRKNHKISILRHMLKIPDIMLFDEPASTLDANSIDMFAYYLYKIKNDKIIIMISHDERIKSSTMKQYISKNRKN